MLRIIATTLALSFATTGLYGCGGGGGNTKGDDLSSYDKLKAIPTELQAEVDKLMAPMNSVDALIKQAGELPAKASLDVPTFNAFVAKLLNGEPGIEVPSVPDTAKGEMDAFVTSVKAFQAAIAATPDNATALTAMIAEKSATVPALVSAVAAESTAVTANPFASAADKAKAKTESAGAKALAGDIEKQIGTIKGDLGGIPAKAAGALTKLQAALMKG
jgi:hypothetical protein